MDQLWTMEGMYLTEEERNTPVHFRDLEVIIKMMEESEKEIFEYFDKKIVVTFDNVIDALSDRFLSMSYQHERLEQFTLSYISRMNRIDKEAVEDEYKRWCREFDNLNKHLLEGNKNG